MRRTSAIRTISIETRRPIETRWKPKTAPVHGPKTQPCRTPKQLGRDGEEPEHPAPRRTRTRGRARRAAGTPRALRARPAPPSPAASKDRPPNRLMPKTRAQTTSAAKSSAAATVRENALRAVATRSDTPVRRWRVPDREFIAHSSSSRSSGAKCCATRRGVDVRQTGGPPRRRAVLVYHLRADALRRNRARGGCARRSGIRAALPHRSRAPRPSVSCRWAIRRLVGDFAFNTSAPALGSAPRMDGTSGSAKAGSEETVERPCSSPSSDWGTLIRVSRSRT